MSLGQVKTLASINLFNVIENIAFYFTIITFYFISYSRHIHSSNNEIQIQKSEQLIKQHHYALPTIHT